MLNASNAFKRLLYEGKRNYLERVDIVLENRKELSLTNKDLWQGGLSFEDAVSNDNTFEIGSAIINKCTITINNIYDDFSEHDFANAEATVYVGLELPDGKKEWIRKGVFAVDEPKYNGGMITLSCLDNMRKFDKPYSESKLIYPATLGQIVRDACSKCDVILQTDTFPHHDHIVEERPADEATTFREVISWAAQIAGCFCRCDVFGRLELKWYDQEALETAGLDGGIFDKGNPSVYESGDSADGGSFRPWNVGYEADGGTFAELNKVHHITSNYSMDISTDDVVITGIRVLEKTKEEDKEAIVTYQSGSDGYVISIENNGLIQGGAGQQIAEWLGQQLIGFRFRRANASHPSDPTMEAGDVGFLTDRKGNTYRIVVSCTRFTTGGSQTTVSSAQNPARNSAARFSAETKNYVESRKSAKDEISFYDKTVQNMTKLISQGFGMYFTPVPQEDGGNHWFMHNKPTIEESNYVWQMTDNGLMVSLDGGLSWAVDRNGNALYNVITTRGLNADWINSGEIKVGPTGRETFYANYTTGVVRIVADSFSLTSGKTINSIAQDEAQKEAGKKNKVFTSTPTTPYNVGDLWMASDKSEVKVCVTAKAEGKAFSSNDWKKRDNYVDASQVPAAWADTESGATQDQVLKKLTNNYADKGIYLQSGKLYISFNAARGGELTLGGADNQYGIFKVKNRYNWDLVSFDNSSNMFRIVADYTTSENNATGFPFYKQVFGVLGIDFYKGRISNGNEFENEKTGKLRVRNFVSTGKKLHEVELYSIGGDEPITAISVRKDEGEASGRMASVVVYRDGVGIAPQVAVETIGHALTRAGENYPKINLDSNRVTITKHLQVDGGFSVSGGTKSKISDTLDYGERLLYCYEMPSPMFGDIGEGETDENGICYVYLDDVFQETIASGMEYQAFLQKEGEGDIWVEKKTGEYFLVMGTANLKFAWEVKAKQKDFEYERLEAPELEEETKTDYEAIYRAEILDLIRQREEILYETA